MNAATSCCPCPLRCRWDRFFAACTNCKVDFIATNVFTCDADAALHYVQAVRR